MENEKLEKLKKQQKLLFIAAPLTAFMAAMKYFGLFSLGAFPPYVEAGLSAYCVVFAIYTSSQIKKLENENQT